MAKKRANGEGNIRKRKDGRWEGRYTAGYDQDGKRIIKNVLGRTQAEVKAKLSVAIAESQQLDVSRSGEYTVAEWLRVWFELYAKPNIRPSTAGYYRRAMEEYTIPRIGSIKLNKLRPMALENMMRELRKRTCRGKPVQEKTAQKYLTVVSAVLSDAKRNEIIQKNPARMIDLPATRHREQFIPTVDEAQRLLQALAKEPRHFRVFYLLAMATGCRRGELCALKWSDFQSGGDGFLLTVSRSRSIVAGKGVVEGSTKNGHSRQIILSSALRGVLLSYRWRLMQEAAKRRSDLSPYLFVNEQGQLLHPDTFTKRLRKIYDAIGFPKEYHLHTLRHFFVSTLLHSGIDKQTVAELAGHADTGFLERTYCHPEMARKRDAAASMLTSLHPGGGILFPLQSAAGK